MSEKTVTLGEMADAWERMKQAPFSVSIEIHDCRKAGDLVNDAFSGNARYAIRRLEEAIEAVKQAEREAPT